MASGEKKQQRKSSRGNSAKKTARTKKEARKAIAAAARLLLEEYRREKARTGGGDGRGPYSVRLSYLSRTLSSTSLGRITNKKLFSVLHQSGIFHVARTETEGGKRGMEAVVSFAAPARTGPTAHLPEDLYTLAPTVAHSLILHGPKDSKPNTDAAAKDFTAAAAAAATTTATTATTATATAATVTATHTSGGGSRPAAACSSARASLDPVANAPPASAPQPSPEPPSQPPQPAKLSAPPPAASSLTPCAAATAAIPSTTPARLANKQPSPPPQTATAPKAAAAPRAAAARARETPAIAPGARQQRRILIASAVRILLEATDAQEIEDQRLGGIGRPGYADARPPAYGSTSRAAAVRDTVRQRKEWSGMPLPDLAARLGHEEPSDADLGRLLGVFRNAGLFSVRTAKQGQGRGGKGRGGGGADWGDKLVGLRAGRPREGGPFERLPGELVGMDPQEAYNMVLAALSGAGEEIAEGEGQPLQAQQLPQPEHVPDGQLAQRQPQQQHTRPGQGAASAGAPGPAEAAAPATAVPAALLPATTTTTSCEPDGAAAAVRIVRSRLAAVAAREVLSRFRRRCAAGEINYHHQQQLDIRGSGSGGGSGGSGSSGSGGGGSRQEPFALDLSLIGMVLREAGVPYTNLQQALTDGGLFVLYGTPAHRTAAFRTLPPAGAVAAAAATGCEKRDVRAMAKLLADPMSVGPEEAYRLLLPEPGGEQEQEQEDQGQGRARELLQQQAVQQQQQHGGPLQSRQGAQVYGNAPQGYGTGAGAGGSIAAGASARGVVGPTHQQQQHHQKQQQLVHKGQGAGRPAAAYPWDGLQGQPSSSLFGSGAVLQLEIGADWRGRCWLAQPQGPGDAGRQPEQEEELGQEQGQGDADGDSCGLGELWGVLPKKLRRAIKKHEQERRTPQNAAASANGGGADVSRPLLVDVAVDAGRAVRLSYSDGSKEVLEGVTVCIDKALRALDSNLTAHSAGQGAGSSGFGAGGGKRRRAGQGADGNSGGSEDEGVADADAGASKRARRQSEHSAGQQGQGQAHGSQGGKRQQKERALAAFGSDNRCCLPGTLHRISCLLDPRSGTCYGLTYRVGRHVPGVAGLLGDVLCDLAGRGRRADAAAAAAGVGAGAAGGRRPVPGLGGAHRDLAGSLLLLGRPGSGKTTLLRDAARLLSVDLGLAVVVVDTSNEIAGGDTRPHGCIGAARRVMVGDRGRLAAAMLEAVQNHGPEVIIVDEIGSKQEVEAARTISQRGVMLVATAHGTDLGSLLRNPELSGLVGGLQSVTLGDRMAVEANGGSKTRLERRGLPTFRSLVEVLGGGRYRLRPDVAGSVDYLLGGPPSAATSAQGPVLCGSAGPGGTSSGGGVGNGGQQQQPGALLVKGADAGQGGSRGGAGFRGLGAGKGGGEGLGWLVAGCVEQLRWVERRGARGMRAKLLNPGDAVEL